MARRRTLFDDRPVEINELTYIIKQDLSALNQQIGGLQVLTKQQHPKADQEGEHNKNVVFMLQGKLTDVSANFKDVLEERTKNIQASRSRTDNVRSSPGLRKGGRMLIWIFVYSSFRAFPSTRNHLSNNQHRRCTEHPNGGRRPQAQICCR